MSEIRPRESVVLADDFVAQVTWYRDVLGFGVTKLFEDGYHYCNMESDSGIKIGIGVAREMGVGPSDRAKNTIILQFEVDDVQAFLKHLKQNKASHIVGPSFDKKDKFWFGGFSDPEGNPFWVVDKNCP